MGEERRLRVLIDGVLEAWRFGVWGWDFGGFWGWGLGPKFRDPVTLELFSSHRLWFVPKFAPDFGCGRKDMHIA